MEQIEKKMFLDLNSVLVKFWIEQGRPDKEIKIELLERMLNWYKKMGYVTLDKQGKDPVNEDLEEEIDAWYNTMGVPVSPDALKETARHFAEWQKEQILKDAVDVKIVESYGCEKGEDGEWRGVVTPTISFEAANLSIGDQIKIVIVKEDKK